MPDRPVSLLLVRHGQSTWNASGRWQGQADPPLSDLGVRQAEEAGRNLKAEEFSAVYASDLHRARRTAEVICAIGGHGPVTIDPGLREFDVGEACGLTRPEIEVRWPGLLADWAAGSIPSLPGGESRADLTDRALATTTSIARSAAEGSQLLVVTHGGLIRALVRGVGGEPESVPNLNGWRFQYDPARSALTASEPVDLLDPGSQTSSPSA